VDHVAQMFDNHNNRVETLFSFQKIQDKVKRDRFSSMAQCRKGVQLALWLAALCLLKKLLKKKAQESQV
jgi:hypothetical protein